MSKTATHPADRHDLISCVFVQGFMPALARPEVDVLEGLTLTGQDLAAYVSI